jgi:hypothetical protein
LLLGSRISLKKIKQNKQIQRTRVGFGFQPRADATTHQRLNEVVLRKKFRQVTSLGKDKEVCVGITSELLIPTSVGKKSLLFFLWNYIYEYNLHKLVDTWNEKISHSFSLS